MPKALIVIGKLVLALLSVAGVALLILEGWLIWHFEHGIGLPTEAKLAKISATEPICPVDGQPAYIPLSDIPPLVAQAVITSEDPDFYERLSINPFTDLVYAAFLNRRPGASHILRSVTHCLASLSPDCCKGPNLERVFGHTFLMARVAKVLSRERILEIYLNENYFGRGAYGVGAAANAYFGKPLGLLSIDEVAFIAALPKAPGQIGRRKDIAVERRNRIIEQMLQSGFVNEADAAFAKQRPLSFRDEPADGPAPQKGL
ncbi:transglycosylase domain-containing protein [Bradyrhizobium sp. CCBAU 051011]|uniref:transglycosylase domain-containing protein n=1 Tax=Bradyrhizobium sp. CCBAU 051011 TaxID=858422 RepID=UPI001FED6CAC|nr:transglycosylase domain-containing protein [Bradyrhizobium sp. CCBAU 051011]